MTLNQIKNRLTEVYTGIVGKAAANEHALKHIGSPLNEIGAMIEAIAQAGPVAVTTLRANPIAAIAAYNASAPAAKVEPPKVKSLEEQYAEITNPVERSRFFAKHGAAMFAAEQKQLCADQAERRRCR